MCLMRAKITKLFTIDITSLVWITKYLGHTDIIIITKDANLTQYIDKNTQTTVI